MDGYHLYRHDHLGNLGNKIELKSFLNFKSIINITNDIMHVGWQAQSKIEQSYSEKPSRTIRIIKIVTLKRLNLALVLMLQ